MIALLSAATSLLPACESNLPLPPAWEGNLPLPPILLAASSYLLASSLARSSEFSRLTSCRDSVTRDISSVRFRSMLIIADMPVGLVAVGDCGRRGRLRIPSTRDYYSVAMDYAAPKIAGLLPGGGGGARVDRRAV